MEEDLTWIELNEKLLDGISKLNALSPEHFLLLLKHIAEARNPLRELTELEVSLNISAADLHFIAQCLSLVFKESQRVILKPTILQNQLIQHLHLEPAKAEEFVKFWSIETNKKFGDFEKRSKLTNISWELNLQTSSSFSSKDANPEARIQLELSNFENNVQDIVTLDNLSEETLVQIYNSLELVQKKLDSLNS